MELVQWDINDADEAENHPLWGWRAQMQRGEISPEGKAGANDMALCFKQGKPCVDEKDDAPEF